MIKAAATVISILLVGILGNDVVPASEYAFDASSFHKKAWEFGGYAEFKGEHIELNSEAGLYKLRFSDEPRQRIERFTGTLELEALFRHGIMTSWARTNSALRYDYQGEEQTHKLYEAVVSLQPDPGRIIDVGKKVTRWGKGYAWNPVGFIERAKDPDDPALSREGYWMLYGDWIRSFSGNLQTIAFTPALVPAFDDINQDFGHSESFNPAAKLYMLYRDTDLDFMFLARGSRSARYGFDFAKNLASNLEVHGELAYISDSKRLISTSQGIFSESDDALSYLLGIRYLSPQDITVIAEYYRNGTGYSEQEIGTFYQNIHTISDNQPNALNHLKQLSKSRYGEANPGRQYLYLRGIWKEPFDLLYFTPSIISIINIEDQSFSMIPEITYRGRDNLELRLRLYLSEGDPLSEYGEKQNDYKLELRLRYCF